MQTKDFSPLWISMWLFRLAALILEKPHWLQLWGFIPSNMCTLRSLLVIFIVGCQNNVYFTQALLWDNWSQKKLFSRWVCIWKAKVVKFHIEPIDLFPYTLVPVLLQMFLCFLLVLRYISVTANMDNQLVSLCVSLSLSFSLLTSSSFQWCIMCGVWHDPGMI